MDKGLSRKVLRYRWLIFAVLAVAYFLVYFHRMSLSVVAEDLAAEFSASASVVGMLGSIYFYCYAVMQFPAGLMSDSIGPRKTVTVFLFIAAAGSLLFGLAPTLGLAFAGRVLVGFGVALVFIPTMKILSQWFRPKEFASMAGILNAVGGGGVLAATWALALLTAAIGWRASFQIIGGATFLIVVLVWLVVRDRPEAVGWPTLATIDGNPPAKSEAEPIPLMAGARRVVTEKYFWPVAFWFFLDCGILFGFGGLWSGPYLMHVYGLTKSQAGGMLSMIAWGMIAGSPLLGWLSDRVLHSRKKIIAGCSLVLTLELMLLYLRPSGLPPALLVLAFFVFSVSASAVVAIGFTTTKELFPVEIAGTSVGTVNLFPFLGGAIFMPMLGRVLDAYPRTAGGAYALAGYKTLLLILLVSALGAFVCSLLMKETFPQE